MKKAIVLIIALVVLPLNFAFAAPAGDLRTKLEQAQSQKAEQLTVIMQEAELMKDILHPSNHAPLPVVSLDVKPLPGDPA